MTTQVRRLLEQVTDPSTKAAHSELCYREARDAATKAIHLAPFAVTDAEAVTLERLGITTSPFATTSHTHSADKILENDCLAIIGHYLPKEPVTFIQLKASKLRLLNRGPGNRDKLENYCHEPKDVLRYGLTNPASCPPVTTTNAVLADTLHFMSTGQLVTLFLNNPKLNKMFATLVLPIEALHKLPSLFPEIYRLEYYANHFAYMPGGHGGGAYVHSYATLKWLSTGQVGTHTNGIISMGQTDFLNIEKIETKGAHHIMLIQRRRADVPWPLAPLWIFHASDYVRLPHIFYPPEANVQNTYPHSLIKRMQTYCLSVKAVSLRDIFAKLRQVIEVGDLQRYSMADLIRLANYLLFTTGMQQVCDYESPLTRGMLARLGASIRMRLRTMLDTFTGKTSYAALLTVVDVIPVPFTTVPVVRPAQGAQWFSSNEEPAEISDLLPGPTLEDLDLLAELEELSSEQGLESKLKEVKQDLQDPSSPLAPETLNEPKLKPTEDETVVEGASSSGTSTAEGLTCGTLTAVDKGKGILIAADQTQEPAATDINWAEWAEELEELVNSPKASSLDLPEEKPESTKIFVGTMSLSLDKSVTGFTRDKNPVHQAPEVKPERKPEEANKSNVDEVPHNNSDLSRASEGQELPKRSLTPQEIEILKLHGFSSLRPQRDGEGWITPVFFNAATSQLSPATKKPGLSGKFHELASHLKRRCYNYRLDNKRATAYMSDVKNNLTGLVLPKLNRDVLSAWLSLCENAQRQLTLLVIHGAGGAGKSRALQELLRNLGDQANDVNVIVPTVNLVLDWKKKMTAMEPKRFITYEKACEREGRGVAIFDDYGKLPAGYIDAYCAIKPSVHTIILTGDQRQSTFHGSNKDAQSANLITNIDHFKKYTDYYVNATHRQPRRLANPIKVHAERQDGGCIKKAGLIADGATVVVPAHRTQVALNDLGRNTFTYSGCQGLTLPHITVVLDNDTPLCSPEVLYTAFSRASESITFVNTHSENPEFLAKLDATPYLKTLISGVREDEDAGRENPIEEPTPKEPLVKTHLPVANMETFLEDKVEAVDDKDVRELWDGEEKTNLMQTENPVVQLFPHQQAKDNALFKITIKERIRTASPDENRKAVAATINLGDLLFEAYAQFMKVPAEAQAFDAELWTHCRQLALRTYLSKPKSNLVQGTARQDPDFPENAIALFNKSQWVKKLEKVGFKFKAGQTISAFKQSSVLLTTTMALYLRQKRKEHQPANVFVMCEKTPEDLNDFVVNRWNFDRDAYTSDYTQYDQSQDATFLNFELRKARHFGVPEEVIAFYRFLKLNARTFVGNLAVMRLSGEGPTFDANTECNIAYDALRFTLDDQTNACYAGDDLVRDKNCPERASWKLFSDKFSLTAKPQVTKKPDFCGWRLTKHGILKSPIQLYQSLQLALQLNQAEEVKRSYAIDYLHAYKMGDRLYDILSEKEMEAHQLTTRILIKKGMKTPIEGSRLPVFHITSDRLIKNPHYKEMHDSTSSRMYLLAPVLIESHF
nr:MAG: replicase [Yunnan alphaflexivirus]